MILSACADDETFDVRRYCYHARTKCGDPTHEKKPTISRTDSYKLTSQQPCGSEISPELEKLVPNIGLN
jgi:hypothetical protein